MAAAKAATAAATATPARVYGFQRLGAHLVMLKDVEGLGKRGDIIYTSTERARNYLVPLKMAYYVPRARKLPMLPKGWVEKSQSSQTEEEAMILPAFFNLAESMRIDAPSPTQSTPDARRAPKSPVDADLYSVLNSIQVIKFRRPLINPGTNDRRIFGSVLVEEIVEAFKQDHGVIVAPSSVKIAARIKEVGSHDISVALPGSERSIKLTVIVEPE